MTAQALQRPAPVTDQARADWWQARARVLLQTVDDLLGTVCEAYQMGFEEGRRAGAAASGDPAGSEAR